MNPTTIVRAKGTSKLALTKGARIKKNALKSNKEHLRTNTEVVRCDWVPNNNLQYIAYHDDEWGIPEYDSIRLFELICLEGQQAGLSWSIILKKRDAYRKEFYNFNPHEVSNLNDNDVKRIMHNPGIIKHKAKIEAVINNSKCYLNMQKNGEEFSDFIWSFVNHTPVTNTWTHMKQVPNKTPVSEALSIALKKRGFKYIGSTICYAFMQACGLVNDHLLNCFCYEKVKNLNKQ